MLDAKYYRTEGTPAFINEVLTPEQWRSYVSDYDFGPVAPNRIVLHHTWKPRLEDWRGLVSIRGMQNHYARLGWTAAPHIYAAPDGIWLATPMNTVGIHAGSGNSSVWNGRWSYSIGIEMVGNYDKVRPSGPVWLNTLEVMGGLVRRLGLRLERDVTFHRDYTNKKSCPGWSVTKPWVFGELNAWLARTNLGLTGLTVVAEPRISEAKFELVLNQHQSPAAAEARQLYRICVAEGIDPAVALAFFYHESSLGKAGICKEFDLKNWGNVRTPEDPKLGQSIQIPGRGPFCKYATWSMGLLDWCKRMKGPKYAGAGLHTVETIIPKYAPSSDGNAPNSYIKAVRSLVEDWQTEEKGQPAPAQPHSWYVTVTAEALNIRQGPHTKYPIVGQLRKGEKVLVDSTKDEGQGTWLHLADHRGFISEKYTVRS